MYVPKHFALEAAVELSAFVRANPFATVISLLNGALVAHARTGTARRQRCDRWQAYRPLRTR